MSTKCTIAAALLSVGLFATGCAANSSTPATSSSPSAAAVSIDQCLNDGKVWLTVSTDKGESLANQCVGNPATGAEALTNAGLELVRDKGMLCTIGGYPAQCPATFTGEYWQYYQGTPGSAWQYSQLGADDAKPTGGTIEGWCYGETCSPAAMGGVTTP